jgi:hypothetical protein
MATKRNAIKVRKEAVCFEDAVRENSQLEPIESDFN